MEEKEVKTPMENRLFMIEMIGKTFIIREALPHGNVVHVVGDFSALSDFFSSL